MSIEISIEIPGESFQLSVFSFRPDRNQMAKSVKCCGKRGYNVARFEVGLKKAFFEVDSIDISIEIIEMSIEIPGEGFHASSFIP